MKKLLILTLCAIMAIPALAQEASSGNSSSPSFRFGIKVTPNVSWFRPVDKKILEGAGGKAKIGFGLIAEFKLAQNYSFATGVEFPSFSGGNLKIVSDSITYLSNKDTFNLKTREYNLQYVELPVTLKLKTNEIGYFTYFGQVGAQIGVRTKATAVDEGSFTSANSTNSTIKDVDISKEVFLLKAALTIGGGAEYNLSGNTSILFGVNYMYGITNALKKKSDALRNPDGTTFEQKANMDQVVLTIGILF